MPITRALVPVDGSKVALKSCRLAGQLAAKQGWDIILFHVLERPPMPSFAFPDNVQDKEMRELEQDGRRVLAEAEEVFAGTDVKVTGKLIDGSVPEMILQEIEEGCCGIVIIGSTGIGRGRLGALFLGSVAEQVVRRSKVPVLLVREDTLVD